LTTWVSKKKHTGKIAVRAKAHPGKIICFFIVDYIDVAIFTKKQIESHRAKLKYLIKQNFIQTMPAMPCMQIEAISIEKVPRMGHFVGTHGWCKKQKFAIRPHRMISKGIAGIKDYFCGKEHHQNGKDEHS
jgi:hypothetical protein